MKEKSEKGVKELRWNDENIKKSGGAGVIQPRSYNSSHVLGTPLDPTIKLGACFFLSFEAQQKKFKFSVQIPAYNRHILYLFIINIPFLHSWIYSLS